MGLKRTCFLVMGILTLPLCSSDFFCSEAFQCANKTTFFNESTKLYSTGYKSHYGSISSITSNILRCYGAFACAKVSLISTTNVKCAADLSCYKVANIQMYFASDQFIDASGVNSLIHATVSDAAQLDIFCRAEQSCAYSSISGFSAIEASGAYSLLDATLDSIHGPTNISIAFYGYYAGFGTIIICRSGQMCNIRCYNNGCNNLHLNCDNNCIVDATINDILSIQDVLFYDSFSISQQNDAACSAQVDEMSFDNDKERYLVTDMLDNIYGGPICCRAYYSCQKNNIQYTSATDEAIICSGRQSCSGVHSFIYNQGPVFCGGMQSCYNTHIITTKSVYCNGYNSCKNTFIFKSSNIYCTAHRSCFLSLITSNGTDLRLYLSGYESGKEANVTCSSSDDCSIFCYGYKACMDLHLVCDGTCTVDCDTDTLCPDGWKSTQDPSIMPSVAPNAPPSALPTAIPTVLMITTGELTVATITQLTALLPSTSAARDTTTNEPDHEHVLPNSTTTNITLIIIVSSSIIVIMVFIGFIIHQFIGLKQQDAKECDKQEQAASVALDRVQEESMDEDSDNMIDAVEMNRIISVNVDSVADHDNSMDIDAVGGQITKGTSNIADDEFVIKGEDSINEERNEYVTASK